MQTYKLCKEGVAQDMFVMEAGSILVLVGETQLMDAFAKPTLAQTRCCEEALTHVKLVIEAVKIFALVEKINVMDAFVNRYNYMTDFNRSNCKR